MKNKTTELTVYVSSFNFLKKFFTTITFYGKFVIGITNYEVDANETFSKKWQIFFEMFGL